MEGQTQVITDYLGGFQYLDGKLDFIPHAEGYVKAVHTGNTTEFHYVYNYTDHLGNIRLSYGRDPETNEVAILKESHYYPFGLQHNGYVGNHRVFEPIRIRGGGGTSVNLVPVRNYLDDTYRYDFNAKEHQPELGLNRHDYHARNYDAALGRWMNVDPLGEEMPSWSPYNYAFNNPVYFIDPDGRMAEDFNNNPRRHPDRIVYEYLGKQTHSVTTHSYKTEENEDGSITETRTKTTTTISKDTDADSNTFGQITNQTKSTTTTGVRNEDGYKETSKGRTKEISRKDMTDNNFFANHLNAVNGVREFTSSNSGSLTQNRQAMNDVVGGISISGFLASAIFYNSAVISRTNFWIGAITGGYWLYDVGDRKYGNHEGRKRYLGAFPNNSSD